MEWFKKARVEIDSTNKKEIPDGLWTKCPHCGEIIYVKEIEKEHWVCKICSYHFRLQSDDYIKMILDDGRLEEHDADLVSGDPLKFKDSKRYPARIRQAQEKTGLTEAVRVGIGRIDGRMVSFAVMDFRFIGGSMGSVVGEKIARAIERSLEGRMPLVIISTSGGARMQEGILSLLQMAKTSALLSQLQKTNIPYISVLTNPTTAGVMASYASLGDIIIAEPKALLGFAGQRVIQQTIKQELPEGFQTSEFFLEHGFVDLISPRKDLKKNLSLLLGYLSND
ncbi:MAG: acetyl-CoA carboxylase carboxyltransferase subunit beta [Candidatus Zixiibacteriota bacterium]|nr:MAG: acetyl-CoA carboxylase carboxyltransferase subunit beta [candidate division Zixibacteria bacterium]